MARASIRAAFTEASAADSSAALVVPSSCRGFSDAQARNH